MLKPLAALAACLLVCPPPSRAGQLFDATAPGAGGISSEHSSFAEMLDSVVRNAFTTLSTRPGPFTATVTYMGAPSTLTVTPGFNGRAATLRLQSVGFDQTFTGTSAAELRGKVEAYLRSDSTAIISNFSKAAALTSALSITDGNPASSTASAARSIFFNQGLSPAYNSIEGPDATDRASSAFGIASLSVSRGTIEAEIAGETHRGEQLRADINVASLRINRRLRLELPVTAEYTNIENTEIFGIGATLAAPLTLITPTSARPFGWKLAPVVGLHSRGSFDAASAGISWHIGLVNVVDWHVNDRLVISAINQVTTHRALPLNMGDYAMDSDIDQTILKNGISLTASLTRTLHSQLYLIDTRFMNQATVPSYYTAGISFDLRTSRHTTAGIGFESDFADNYHSLLARVQFNCAW